MNIADCPARNASRRGGTWCFPIGSIAGIVGYVSDQNLVTISEQPAAETTPEYFRNALKEIDVWRFISWRIHRS